MNRDRALALALRQRELLLHSTLLRTELTQQLVPLQAPLHLADRAQAGWRWLQRHPELPVALAVVLVVLRPARAWRWGTRLWWGWRAWRRVLRMTATLR